MAFGTSAPQGVPEESGRNPERIPEPALQRTGLLAEMRREQLSGKVAEKTLGPVLMTLLGAMAVDYLTEDGEKPKKKPAEKLKTPSSGLKAARVALAAEVAAKKSESETNEEDEEEKEGEKEEKTEEEKKKEEEKKDQLPPAESGLKTGAARRFSHREMESDLAVKSADSNTTMCSYTVRQNFEKFGIRAPRGDAAEVARWYENNPTLKNRIAKSEGRGNADIQRVLDGCDYQIADVFVKSTSQYGHRAMAFRSSEDNQWYILDPYRAMIDPVTHEQRRTTKPIPFVAYSGQIEFAVPIDSGIGALAPAEDIEANV